MHTTKHAKCCVSLCDTHREQSCARVQALMLGSQAKQGRRAIACAAHVHTVGALKTMPKVCSSDTTSEATRLSHTQLMQMLIAAKPASILRSPSDCESSVAASCMAVYYCCSCGLMFKLPHVTLCLLPSAGCREAYKAACNHLTQSHGLQNGLVCIGCKYDSNNEARCGRPEG